MFKRYSYSASIIFIIIILFVIVAGCDESTSSPRSGYDVVITGLENFYSNNDTVTLMLPVPMDNGTTIITNSSFDDAAYSRVNSSGEHPIPNCKQDISAEIVNTEYGDMVALTENKTDYYYSDIPNQPADKILIFKINKSNTSFNDFLVYNDGWLLEFDKPTLEERRALINKTLSEMPLKPVSDINATKYTVWYNSTMTSYTSYIYIDNNLKPIIPGNNTIEIRLIFRTEEGMVKNQGGKCYYFWVHERIPEGVTGFIPIKVQVLGSVDIDTVYGTGLMNTEPV